MLKKGTKVCTAFSEYIVDEQINQGGNGTVFRVHDSLNNMKYALKAIDREKTSREKLSRFKNEINFCEHNSDPNIIKVLDHGAYNAEEGIIVFYVMPIYERTLRMFMKDGIKPENSLSIITQVLSGLRFAHSKGVWHRDIKPENILIDGDGNAVIADFGIAHFSSDDLATYVETKQSDRMANFQYAAPEQRIRNGLVDGRADIYSVGLIINEMFTHTLAMGSNYTKIGDVVPTYAWLDSVVDSMLQQNPDSRPFPTSTVATRILAAKNDWQQSQELLRLAEEQTQQEGPYQMDIPTIRDALYEDGYVKVFLDGIEYKWFDKWFGVIQQGSYNHTVLMGYDTQRLKRFARDCIAMPVHSTREYDLKSIANNLKNWIVDATILFNQEQRAEYNRKCTEQRNKKVAEIQRLKDEARMQKAVRDLFK